MNPQDVKIQLENLQSGVAGLSNILESSLGDLLKNISPEQAKDLKKQMDNLKVGDLNKTMNDLNKSMEKVKDLIKG